jgi:hypothetical protein
VVYFVLKFWDQVSEEDVLISFAWWVFVGVIVQDLLSGDVKS